MAVPSVLLELCKNIRHDLQLFPGDVEVTEIDVVSWDFSVGTGWYRMR